MRRSFLFLLACAAAFPAVLYAQTEATRRVAPTPVGYTRLRVAVANALADDAPVPGVLVELPGHPGVQGVTDEHGLVDLPFVAEPGQRTVRIFAHPGVGLTFGAHEAALDTDDLFERVFVVPDAELTTGMLDPSARHELVLAGTARGLDGEVPFDLGITIPAGTFAVPFRLDVTPRPAKANFWNGIAEPSWIGGILHVTPRDAQGRRLSDVLAHPVTFDHPQWFLTDLPMTAGNLHAAGQPPAPAEFRIYRYDYGAHLLVDLETTAEVDVEAGRLRYSVSHFSGFGWLRSLVDGRGARRRDGDRSSPPDDDGDDGPGPGPRPEPPDIENPEDVAIRVVTECTEVCNMTVGCEGAGFCNYETTSNREVTISAQLQQEWQASVEGKTSGAASVLGKLSAKAGTEVSMGLSGELQAGTVRTYGGGWEQGYSPLSACYTGRVFGYERKRVLCVSVGGVHKGTITVPQGFSTGYDLQYDTRCPGCDVRVGHAPRVDLGPCGEKGGCED